MRFERKKFRSRIESEPIARLSKTHHNYRGAPFAREEYEAASQSLFLSLSLSPSRGIRHFYLRAWAPGADEL